MNQAATCKKSSGISNLSRLLLFRNTFHRSSLVALLVCVITFVVKSELGEAVSEAHCWTAGGVACSLTSQAEVRIKSIPIIQLW